MTSFSFRDEIRHIPDRGFNGLAGFSPIAMIIKDQDADASTLDGFSLEGQMSNTMRVWWTGESDCLRCVSDIVFRQEVEAVLIHADTFLFSVYGQRSVKTSRHLELELTGVFKKLRVFNRFSNLNVVFQSRSKPHLFCIVCAFYYGLYLLNICAFDGTMLGDCDCSFALFTE